MGIGDFVPELHRLVSLVSAQAPSQPSGDDSRQLQHLARLREAGKISETITPLRLLVRRNPRNPSAHYDLGLTYRICNRLPEAIACFERAIALKPDYANAYYNLGLVLEQQGREANAAAAYRRAITAAPKLADAHSRLGILLGLQGNSAEAIECFRRAAAASSDLVTKRLAQARSLLPEEKFIEAEKSLRHAIAISPRNAEAHTVLGLAMHRAGRFAEAVLHSEQAIALGTADPSAYYFLSISKKITEADRPLIGQMLQQLDRADIASRTRMSLHFALGKAFDELAEYAQAMQHFDEANRLAGLDLAFDRDKFSAENDHLIARFTPDFFKTHAGLGANDELPILIVGMPRSGTTLVEQIISAHPMVGAGDELVFWNDAAPAFLQNETEGPEPADVGADRRRLLRPAAPDRGEIAARDRQNAG